MSKRIAVQLFGHLRTFRETFESYLKYIIEPNINAGYEIDVFMHIWDLLEFAGHTYHNQNSEISGCKLSDDDLQFIKENYKPNVLAIEEQTDGKAIQYTMTAVNNLRISYSMQNNINYDWVIMTRPDILFLAPFLPDKYIETYYNTDLCNVPVPFNSLFVGNNILGRMNVADPRYVCEWDLIWFSKPEALVGEIHFSNFKMVPIRYRLNEHFKIKRVDKAPLQKGINLEAGVKNDI